MHDRARMLWARTRLVEWPGRYELVSLPVDAAPEAAALAGTGAGRFAALVLERDEVSLTVAEEAWSASPLRARARSAAGPYRVVTLDLDLELDVVGYLAPAAERLAAAGVSIVPQCGFLKDHLLFRDGDLARAREVLEAWITECRG